jgi:peptidyl-prolyl cis-trans isomerase C
MANRAGLLLGAALSAVLALPATAQDAEQGSEQTAVTADTVVASVNGTEITLGHLIVLRGQLPQQYRQLPDEALFGGLLEQAIQQEALAQSMAGGLTKREQLALDNEHRAFVAAAALGRVAEGAVTDETLREAYDARFADFEPGREYNAAHILVETEEQAVELKGQIDGGAEFADLAREHSTDGAAANGGALGWFGLGMMVPEFEEAVLALEVGQVSDPVETQFGWHLVRLNDTRLATAPTLEEVRESIAGELRDGAVQGHIEAITAEADVTRNADGIDPAVLRDQTLLAD